MDTQHHSRLSEFRKQDDVILEKQRHLDALKAKQNAMISGGLSNLMQEQFDVYLSIRDGIVELDKELEQLKNASQEIDYYLDNADIIFKYYDIKENGNVAENETSAVVTENSILKFFASHIEDDEAQSAAKDEDRASLLERYMEHTDGNYLKSAVTEENETCTNCSSGNRTLLINDGLVMCNECFTIETVIVDHEKPSYKDPPKEISYFSYKRLFGLLKCFQSASDAFGIATSPNCWNILTHPSYALVSHQCETVWNWTISSPSLV